MTEERRETESGRWDFVRVGDVVISIFKNPLPEGKGHAFKCSVQQLYRRDGETRSTSSIDEGLLSALKDAAEDARQLIRRERLGSST